MLRRLRSQLRHRRRQVRRRDAATQHKTSVRDISAQATVTVSHSSTQYCPLELHQVQYLAGAHPRCDDNARAITNRDTVNYLQHTSTNDNGSSLTPTPSETTQRKLDGIAKLIVDQNRRLKPNSDNAIAVYVDRQLHTSEWYITKQASTFAAATVGR